MILFETPDGTHIYADQKGTGEPLLLIPGLGAGAWLWKKMQPDLSRRFQLTMPELRGSGRSDKPDCRYSVPLFASDMNFIIEQLQISRLHILGVSMGGFVAQYLAAQWPDRVSSLTLVSTSCGGENQIGPDGTTLCHVIRPRGRTKKERLEDAYSLNFTKDFMTSHARELEAITEWRTTYPQPEFAYYRQLLAGNAFDGTRFARQITAPTLICAGKDDPLVPMDDVQQLHKNIPHSKLLIFAGKHLFFFEKHGEFNQILAAFLAEHAIGSRAEITTVSA